MNPQSNQFDLQEQVAIVTGAGNGIGRAIALRLAGHGAKVVIADLNIHAANTVADEITQSSGAAIPVRVDVTDPESVDELTKKSLAHFDRVDILINNAGGGRSLENTLGMSVEDWKATIDLTLTSAFLCSREVGTSMIKRGSGRIINIASVYGIVGHDSSLYDPRPNGQQPESLAYAAAKGGLVSMTRALAVYWAPHQINVNAIAPGMVRTERLGETISSQTWDRLSARTPLGRPAVPDDIAGAAVYLSAPASAYVTGQVLVVDGGWTIW